ncbi:hypothetical protein [Shimia sagamensis]|uniref:Uncharacterized protein n=1 Tax=Shimia sagamensis TaxID=1566352 RepID=A0ABY1PDG3_9RHOB|nr:hypothetical protein [Shimia sagamensis]SMP32022.1 hypothetical protein SAMN06265373_108117 [Shimia sagamensis]
MTNISKIIRVEQKKALPLTAEEELPDEWLQKVAAGDVDALNEAAHSLKTQEMAQQVLTHRAFDRARASFRQTTGQTLVTRKAGRIQ